MTAEDALAYTIMACAALYVVGKGNAPLSTRAITPQGAPLRPARPSRAMSPKGDPRGGRPLKDPAGPSRMASFRLPPATVEAIRGLAADLGVSQAEAIRLAIAAYRAGGPHQAEDSERQTLHSRQQVTRFPESFAPPAE